MKRLEGSEDKAKLNLAEFLPPGIGKLKNPQTELPRIAKDPKLTAAIETAIRGLPTTHNLYLQDARDMPRLESESVHLVVTPPYWTLKEYPRIKGQLGNVLMGFSGSVSALPAVHRVVTPRMSRQPASALDKSQGSGGPRRKCFDIRSRQRLSFISHAAWCRIGLRATG